MFHRGSTSGDTVALPTAETVVEGTTHASLTLCGSTVVSAGRSTRPPCSSENDFTLEQDFVTCDVL